MALNRGIHADTLAALSGGVFFPVVLVHVDWPGAPVYCHSGVGNIAFDGQTWAGVGEFGSVQLPGESLGLASQPAVLRIVGLPDTLDGYLGDDIRNRTARVLFGCVTERAGNILIGEPFEVFTGYVDAMEEEVQAGEDGGRPVIVRGLTLSVAQGPSQRSTAGVYHTEQDQSRAYPGDTAGRHTAAAEAKAQKMRWPE